ncbi:MAG: LacI family DNA-binding transcriptional regulator [Desulfopila sp.]
MARKVTMRGIAERAGVSSATVSRTFQSPQKVRKEIRDKILRIAQEHGYVYNAAAGDLAREFSNIIGVLVPTSNKSVFADTLNAIQEQAQDYGYSVIIGSTQYDHGREQQLIRQMQERRVAGIILTGFALGQETLVTELIQSGVSCVVIWEIITDQRVNYVGFDNFKAAYSAVAYLISLRHRRIGLLIGPYDKVGRTRKRFLGYQQALNDHQIAYDPKLVVYSAEPDLFEGKQGMSHLLEIDDGPTAVFAANDRLAIGAYSAIKARALSIPDDISIVGLDDVDFAAYCDPPLTTVRVPAKEMGRIAVDILTDLNAGKANSVRRYSLETELIIRGSCRELKF